MQRAEESESRAGGLTPLNAFLVGLGLLVAIAAVVLLSRPDKAPVPSPDPNPEPAFALKDAEAIARFEELDALRIRALRNRDVTLLPEVFTEGSEAARGVSKSITRLVRNDVFFRTRYVTEELRVVQNSSTEIVLRQTSVVTPKFVDADGNEVTVAGRTQRQTTEWTLRLVGDNWLIAKGSIVAAENAGAGDQ